MEHITVLKEEAVDALHLSAHSTVVDATYGSGGHANAILTRLNERGCYVGIDADESALTGIDVARHKATVHLVHENFRNIAEILRSLHIEKVDAILADLGWRMEQFSDGGKGFSFAQSEPLQMTFGDPNDYPFTAADIVNEWSEETLANIFYGYAEERFSRRIAKAIVEARAKTVITTSTQLANIVLAALPKAVGHKRIHGATKVFQALRIAVNDELGALETLLKDGFTALRPGGHMAIITFHSIEDRLVKHYFRELVREGRGDFAPKKPIAPTATEAAHNPRARSAKLRIIKKL
ncbi:MAG: 16S rRNA (cytosine(1402)-N(4))-methyltransferase RsmH [Patescibacteria group bacterium]